MRSGAMCWWRRKFVERMQERLANLLSVKSLVTVILTVIFAGLSVRGSVSSEQFLTVFTVVISFYYGTQATREGEKK